MLQNNSGSSGSVLLCPSAGEGKAYPAQMFRHSMKQFFMTVWRLCDHIVQFSWLVSVGNSFRSTHLWPGVPWCNSNRGQNCWAQTCSPMFTQTGCESSTNTFVLNRWTRRLLALIQKTQTSPSLRLTYRSFALDVGMSLQYSAGFYSRCLVAIDGHSPPMPSPAV